jgi:hypothetical protein
MPVFAFLGLRFFFAALLLLPFCRGLRVERQQWPRMIISGLWFALNLCLWIYSVSTTPSLGEGAFIMSLSMLFVPLTAWVMMKARPARATGSACRSRLSASACSACICRLRFTPARAGSLTALVQSIWFCYTSKSAREVLIPLTTVQLGITGIVGLGISAAVESWTSRLPCRPSAGCSPASLSPPACASACK